MTAATHSRHRFSKVDLGLLVTIVIWGVNYAAIKSALRELDPHVFNAVRFVLATVTLAALARGRGALGRIPRHDLARLALLGILGNTVYQVVFIEGIARTTAANAALVMSSCPMLVALLATALGRDRLPAVAWAGVALAVGGLALVLAAGSHNEFVTGNLAGDLLILASAAIWAAYTVLATRVMARTPPIAATLVTFVSGTPPLVLLALPAAARQDWGAVGARGWSGVAFSGVFAIGIAYMLWNAGIAALGGARTAVYQNFTPVIAAAVAWVTLGERWTPAQFLGAAAVLAGIALTRSRGASRAGATSPTPATGNAPSGPA